MRMLVLIPARGGSKGVPGKNIKLLNGKPLISYTIDSALGVFPREDICVSTDSEEIKTVVERYGINVPFLRPNELATDAASSYDVWKHAISFYETLNIKYDGLVVLQPTSPFRTSKHIKSAIALYSSDIDMVVSVKETKSNPYFVLFEENIEGYLIKSKSGNFIRRQECPKVWEYNGAIYVVNFASLKDGSMQNFTKIKKYVMDAVSSLDIDSVLDWEFCEFLCLKHNHLLGRPNG